MRSLVIGLLLLPFLGLAVEASQRFSDIPDGHWASVPAQVLDDHRIMAGRTAVSFAGDAALTRYELAGILSALYGVRGAPPSFLMLGDVPPGHPAMLAVQRVLGFGLMNPVAGAQFAGERAVSRRLFMEALSLLLEKNGVQAPGRRKQPIRFVDVAPDSSFGRVLDVLVNRFGVLEVPGGIEFHPVQVMNRYQALGILVRLLPHLDPVIASECRASAGPGTGLPTVAPTPSTSVESGIISPVPVSSGVGTAPGVSQGGAVREIDTRAEVVLLYDEALPTQPGAVVGSELRQYSGVMLPAGGFGASWWESDWAAMLRVRSFYLGVNAPHAGAQVPVDLLDTHISGAWLWRVLASADGGLALGAAGQWRTVYNLSAKLVSQYYLTADKTFMGAGPAVFGRWKLAPGWQTHLECLTFPIYVQTYNLPVGSRVLQRWGVDGRLTLQYDWGNGWRASGGGHGFMSGAYEGGTLALLGAELGMSRVF